jgi:hypothetical protein
LSVPVCLSGVIRLFSFAGRRFLAPHNSSTPIVFGVFGWLAEIDFSGTFCLPKILVHCFLSSPQPLRFSFWFFSPVYERLACLSPYMILG